MNDSDKRIYGCDTVIIPDEIVPKILSLYYGERATTDLRVMGENMGKIRIDVPSNINVWQHLKGESTMARAAQSLTEAAQALTEKITPDSAPTLSTHE